MARIQILPLPPYGRDGEEPFALIVDQCDPAAVSLGWQQFGEKIGACGVKVTSERVDIVDGTGEDAALVEFDHAALAESFATALRFHLESGEASEAVRDWCERRAAASGGQPR